MKRFMSKLSYANVMATIALFIALGGSSYAAFVLPRDSVGSKQIRKGAVRSTEIKDRLHRAPRHQRARSQSASRRPGSPGGARERLATGSQVLRRRHRGRHLRQR